MHRQRIIGEGGCSSSQSYRTRSRSCRCRIGRQLFVLTGAFASFLVVGDALRSNDGDAAAAAAAAAAERPELAISADERHVLVDGTPFLSLAPFHVRLFNRTSDSRDGGDLRVLSRSTTVGRDARGAFVSRVTDWTDDRWPGESSSSADGELPHYRTSTRVYPDRMAVEFEQRFPRGMQGCDVFGSPEEEASTAGGGAGGAGAPLRATFPTFRVDPPPDNATKGDGGGDLSYFIYDSQFLEHPRRGFFRPNASLPLGIRTGPMLLFRRHPGVAGGLISAVLSHSNEFMTQSVVHDGMVSTLSFGPMGTLCDLPPGYATRTILVLDATSSVLSAARNWGSMLLGNLTRRTRDDYASRHLGYSTDNGAYYYYHREPGSPTMEDTLLRVADHARNRSIPYRYWLLDSWWYYRDARTGGVANWTARPDVFPHGLDGLYDGTGMLVQAHNRYWSPHPSYESTYPFVHSGNNSTSLPVGRDFWLNLFRGARERWGLRVYEQDWLNVQFEGLTQSFTDPTLLRRWLVDMGHAAEECGIAIQYCMPLGRHLLQSTEIPSVTQVRATDDYVTEDQWDVGVTSLLHWALRLRPSKDSAWSRGEQPGNPYRGRVETSPKLQAYMMALSTGPVAFSDRIGHSNRDLIMRTCRLDGVLLQPVQPPIPIHEWFHHQSLGDDIGHIRESKMRVDGIPVPYFVVLAVNLTRPFVLEPWHLHEFPEPLSASALASSSPSGSRHPDDASPAAPPPRYVAYTTRDGGEWMEQPFSSSRPLTLAAAARRPTSTPATLDDFWCWYVAPIYHGWVVYGEMDKIVPVAGGRISHVGCERYGPSSTSSTSPSPTSGTCELLQLHLRGVPGERINLTLGYYFHRDPLPHVDNGDGGAGKGASMPRREKHYRRGAAAERGKCTVEFSPLPSSSNGEVVMELVVNADLWPRPESCRAVPAKNVEDGDPLEQAVN